MKRLAYLLLTCLAFLGGCGTLAPVVEVAPVVQQATQDAPVLCATKQCDTAFDVAPIEGNMFSDMAGFIQEQNRLPWENAQAPPQTALFILPFLGGTQGTAVPVPDGYWPLQTTLVPSWSAGSGTPTFTRATTAYQTDFEGKLNLVASGEPRFQGARREANLVATKSEDWTNGAWTKTIGTVTATTLTSTGANQTVLQTYTAASANYVLRVRMSRITGTGDIQLTLDGGSTWTTVTLTGSAQVFSIAQTAVTNPQFGIRIVTSGDAINADQIAVYDTTGKTNTNPPEYVSVGVLSAPFHGAGVDGVAYYSYLNPWTVSSNVATDSGVRTQIVTGASGVAATAPVDAGGPLGYLPEGARADVLGTTAAIRRTMTDVGWVASNVTVGTATGVDGVGSAGASLTASAGNGTILFTTVLASAQRTYSVWARRKTGTGTVNITDDNGAHWTAITLTTVYQQFQITRTQANPIVGFQIVTNTDAIEVDFNTIEAAAFANPTPIPVNVSKAADVLTYAANGNIVGTQGTAYAETQQSLGVGSGGTIIYLDDGAGGATTNGMIFAMNSTTVLRTRIWTAGVNQFDMSGVVSAGAQLKSAVAWSATASLVSNGSVLDTDASMIGPSTGLTTLQVGNDASGATPLFGTIRKVGIWLQAMSSTQLTTRTSDAYDWLMPNRVAWTEAANDDEYRLRANR